MQCQEINRIIENERICAGCPMFGRGAFVGMETSDDNPEKTLLFLGLNPGAEEAREKRPFIGRAGRFLRSSLARAEISQWAMVNSILCSTNNEREIPGLPACHAVCKNNVASIIRTIRPKVIVPCGNGASAVFDMPTGITANAERIFISKGRAGKASATVVMPMLHPSALIRDSGENSSKYVKFIQRLRQIREITGLVESLNGECDNILSEKGIRFEYLFGIK